jgi:signal transduction histidine kinase
VTSVPEALSGLGEGAAWPLALTLATVVGGAARAMESRRRRRINRALHELRRPLQALALQAPSDGAAREAASPSSFELAVAALGDLDREINGAPPEVRMRPVSCRALVEGSVERWRGPAARARRSLRFRWSAGRSLVMADPARVAQALDNLLANALEHGGLSVLVEATLGERGVRVAVADSGRTAPRGGRARDPRRGHGLRVAAEVAAAHGGRLLVERGRQGTIAVLELPLAAA